MTYVAVTPLGTSPQVRRGAERRAYGSAEHLPTFDERQAAYA